MTNKEVMRQSERESWRYADELEQERKRLHEENEALRTALAQPEKEWVGLTDEEAKKTFEKHNCTVSADLAGILARAIEAKLKEKNLWTLNK